LKTLLRYIFIFCVLIPGFNNAGLAGFLIKNKINAGPIVINPASLPPANLNSSYTQTLSSSGGVSPYAYTIVANSGGLPPGLTLLANGTITGIPTTLGPFYFTVKSTDNAANSITKNYSITVIKSNNAYLSGLSLSAGILTPPFATNNFNYNVTVGNNIGSIKVTPTTVNNNATVTVNGSPVTPGTQSAAIPINIGSGNTITTTITAQDGITTQTYTINVTRTLSASYTWTGSTSTFWSDATNWLPNGHPNSGDDVTIGPSVNNPRVDVTASCLSLTVSKATTLTLAFPLTVVGNVKVDSSLTVYNGSTTFTVTGALLIADNMSFITKAGNTISFNSINMGANAFINNAATLSCKGQVATGNQSYLINGGTFNVDDNITLNASSYINNLPGGIFNVNNSGSITTGFLGYILNGGTFKMNTGFLSIGSGDYINNQFGATFSTNGPVSLGFQGAAINSGTFTVNGNLNVGVDAYVNNLAGGIVNCSGNNVISMRYKSRIANSGTINVSAATVRLGNSGYINNVAGATFTINGGATIDFATDTAASAYILNGGTFYAGTSNSRCTANLNYAGVFMRNTGTFYLGSTSIVNLTGYAAYLANSGTFTLQSDLYGSAAIGNISGNAAQVLGNYNIERYISGGSSVYRGYRLLSSPVYQSITGLNKVYSLNYVKASSFITGPGGVPNGFDKDGNPTLYFFRENIAVSNATFTGGNYRGVSNIASAPNYSLVSEPGTFNLPLGNGFYFFFRGDRINNVANKFTAGTTAESVTLTAIGKINTGQIVVHDWYTPASANLGFTNTPGNTDVQGFNLVGNPYPSTIDWNSYNTTTPNSGIYAPNVSNTIYILDPVSKNLGVYQQSTGFSTNNATHIIPSGQGFFVQAFDPGASLTFNEDAKVDSQVVKPHLLLGMPVDHTVSQFLHIKLTQGDTPIDEAFINFDGNAKTGFSLAEDALYRPGNGIGSLASLSSDGYSLSINAQAFPKKSATIALNVNAIADGTYQVSIPGMKSIPKLFDVWLMDAYKKDSLNIKNNTAYSFDIIKGDAASYGTNRFSVVIRQNPTNVYHLLDFTGTKVADGVQLVWKTENEGNYTWFTLERSIDNGKNFDVLGTVNAADQGMYGLTDKSPVSGLNQYRLKQEDFNGAITYSNIVSVLYTSTGGSIAANTINIYPNPAVGNINLSISPTGKSSSFDIRIVNNLGLVVKTATSLQPNWQADVSSLLPGTYIMQVLNSSDKSVVGKGSFIKL
jgi:hypothetical protein